MSKPTITSAQRRQWQRELKTLDQAEKATNKPLRDLVRGQRVFIKEVQTTLRKTDRAITREITRTSRRVAGIQKRRQILSARIAAK